MMGYLLLGCVPDPSKQFYYMSSYLLENVFSFCPQDFLSLYPQGYI